MGKQEKVGTEPPHSLYALWPLDLLRVFIPAKLSALFRVREIPERLGPNLYQATMLVEHNERPPRKLFLGSISTDRQQDYRLYDFRKLVLKVLSR